MSYAGLLALASVLVLALIVLTTPRVKPRQVGRQLTVESSSLPVNLRRWPELLIEVLGRGTRGLVVSGLEQASPRLASRVYMAETPNDRTIGLGVVVSVLVSLVDLRLPIVAISIVLVTRRFGPMILSRKADARKLEAVERATPVLIDLIRSAVASGVSPRTLLLSLQTAVMVDDLSTFDAALDSLQRDMRSGKGFVEALDAFKREGPPILGLIAALQASELYGVPLGPTLDALSLDARLARRRRVETKARRLPVSLLFPLVVFVLPAFMLLTVVPLLFSGLSSIHW
jgi:Type II secretion system (T2SS), protein F